MVWMTLEHLRTRLWALAAPSEVSHRGTPRLREPVDLAQSYPGRKG